MPNKTRQDKRNKVVAFGESFQVAPWGYMGADVVIAGDDIESKFTECLSSKEYAIVMVSESIARDMEEIIRSAGLGGPVVMVIPSGFSKEDQAWSTLRKLVTEAVGVDLLGKENNSWVE
jgi:vacuolar-type H+-ATPase subunit F/Vma7